MVMRLDKIDIHEYRHIDGGVYEGFFVTVRQETTGRLIVLDRSSWDTCYYPVEGSERLRILKKILRK